MIAPDQLPRHELVGLEAEVVSASNPDLVGLSGDIVVETMRTLGIEGADRVFHVPKADATIAVTLDGEDQQVVTVTGERLVARPPRRTEQTGDSKWR
ncbi:MAG: ribonuclease P protein subunit POP4 [Haloarculaceae archaeon]|jgi:ribonuclease P protein subunit POP4